MGAVVSPEMLRQVRLLELRTRGLVNTVFSGEYHSVFKGQGMEFAEVREYQAGDEVRSIDWNVTARMRHPYVKRYIEERELTVMLAADLSGSQRFGTVSRFKSELTTELSAVLAMSAIRNNDRVGTLMFTDRIEHVVPPRKGRRHAMRVIRDLLLLEPEGQGTDIGGAVDYLMKLLPNRAIVFLLSDFVDSGAERPLKLLAQRHDVVAVTVEDPRELSLPDIGLARFSNPETGETVEVNTSDARVRAGYDDALRAERSARTHLLRRLAIDEIAVRTDRSYVEPLLKFFRAPQRQGTPPMIALVLLVAFQGAPAPPVDTARAAQVGGPVQMGVSVLPDTVTVGEHFIVRVRVRAPKGAEIGFPVGPDSGVAVEAVDPRREQEGPDTTVVERTATYALVAWTTGAQKVVLGSLVVSNAGVDHRYDVPAIAIVVKSVRPTDSTGRVPRPARDVMIAPRVLWPWIAGGLLLLVILLWMLRRRLRRRPANAHSGSGALANARRDFARIEELSLIDAGERGRYVALHVDVLREYLAERIPDAARSLTSTELLAALSADAPVPLPRLVPVLAAADLIKYADRPVTANRARELAAESRGIVNAVEEAVLHRAQAAAKPERAA